MTTSSADAARAAATTASGSNGSSGMQRTRAAELTLAHATLYIATAPKSNSATLALGEAHSALKSQPVQTIPSALRSKTGQANKRIGQGVGYNYSHDFPENISGEDFLEKPLTLYTPKTAGWEAKIADRLARWKGLKEQLRKGQG
jgi:putative ATPase